MNALVSRKKLLVAESELNRAQLGQDWQTMADEAHALAGRATRFGLIAATTASVMAGLASLWQKKSAPAATKTSWLQTLLKGAPLVGALWAEFRTAKSSD